MIPRNVPLADKLIQELVTQISSGRLGGENGRLPSEAELCERYAVSRATVREALTKLELAGIVIRRHGVGTFVTGLVREQPGLISGWLDEAPAFAELIARSGHSPATQVLSVTATTAGPVAEPLGLAPEAPVVAIEKLFLADEQPVIYTRTIIPETFLPATLPQPEYRQTTYHLLERHGQRKVHHQASELRAVLADETIVQRLNCRAGNALLRVEEIGYDVEQTALFYALHHLRGDRVSFRQIRTPSFTID